MRCPNAYFERRVITYLVCILRHTGPSMRVHTSFRVSPTSFFFPTIDEVNEDAGRTSVTFDIFTGQ
jgi:hypothetical protein